MDNLYFYYLDLFNQHNIPPFWATVTWYAFPFAIIAAAMILSVLILVLAERKILAFYTLRKGPNRVGLWGTMQTIADAIKLLFKEDIIPAESSKFLFWIAPVIAFAPVMVVWGLIPYNSNFKVINSSVGILLYLAIVSFPVLGVMLAGLASNNKYSLIGGVRSAAQAISYDIPMVMSALGVVVLAGTMNLGDIVNTQSSTSGLFGWYFIPGVIGFVVFYICALAELNRIPFDFSEAESELVSGYNTEYSGMKFALFFLGEYAALFVLCAFIATIYLGGYLSPFGFYFADRISDSFHLTMTASTWLVYLEQIFWLLAKVIILILSILWIRATLPRFRVDVLMNFAWKILLPLAILNFFVVCIYKFWSIS